MEGLSLSKKINIIVFSLVLSILLTSCSLPGLGNSAKNDGIVIAGGSTTERQVLSEILSQMIDYYMPEGKPQLINNLGSTMLIFQAMKREDANISGASYTGTSLTGELAMESTTDPIKAMEEVVKGYNDKFDMVWFPSYGFENTYAFMMSRTKAEELGIEKVSDLAEYKDELKVGIDTGWMDRSGDGYEDFQRIYGFGFKDIMPMEIGLVYDGIYSDEMDIALGYSTDGRINAYDLVIIEDDLKLFPPYDASPVITKKLLKKYPELEIIMLKLEGEISSETMQMLNRLSDEDKIEPTVVAKNFLEENYYFKDKEVVPLRDRELYKDIVIDILGTRGDVK